MEGNDIREIKLEEAKEKPTIRDRIKSCGKTIWEGAKGTAHWIKDNKNDLILIGTGVATVLAVVKGKSVGRYSRREDDRDFRVYDPRSGQYYYLKRRMTNHEKMELDYRLEAGERMGFILDDMNLLRRY